MIELSYDTESRELPTDEILDAMRAAGLAAVRSRGLEDAEISLSFVSPGEMKALNCGHRGVDDVTDVLSFPMLDCRESGDSGLDAALLSGRPALLGDIVICPERAMEQADEYGHGARREFVYLFVHGLLHLLGYDHEDEADRAKMREAEECVMREAGL